MVSLEAIKSSIKDLFKDILDEIKCFKYQITGKVLLRKHKENGAFAPVYFNSTVKTVINSKYDFDKSFQEMLYRIDNWINDGFGWIIESMNGEYVNISIYSLLSGSSHIELSNKLSSSMKGLINIKNNDNKCFLWCHIRPLNPLKIHLEKITKRDKKKWLMILVIKVLNFLSVTKIIARLNRRITFALMYFVMKNSLV